MLNSQSRVVIIGGGIVGLALARRLTNQVQSLTVLEKESGWAAHQTGHNSGVIHAGPYYKPGSFKAKMCLAGNKSMFEFAQEHDIAFERCGKLIISTNEAEDSRLDALAARAQSNGVDCRVISQAEALEFEPHIAATKALRVENTGIIDYKAVSNKLAELSAFDGAKLELNTEVRAIHSYATHVTVEHSRGLVECDLLINAAGLYSDRIAKMAGFTPSVRIVPFRGEYYELRPGREHLVKGLIYPVPDPDLPFLGVHLTRMIDQTVHAGPNAVFALAREGYKWSDISIRETVSTLLSASFLKLAAKNLNTGSREIVRSLSRKMFANDLARLVPEIQVDDIQPSGSGVRAQAINPDGSLADDFVIQRNKNQIHILNAPSPAATSALEIASHVESLLKQ